MFKRELQSYLVLTSLILFVVLLIGGCQRAPTAEATQTSTEFSPTKTEPVQLVTDQPTTTITEEPYPLPTSPIDLQKTLNPSPLPSSTPYPEPLSTKTQPATLIPEASQPQPTNTSTQTSTSTTSSPYPGPDSTNPAPESSQPYPQPQVSPTNPSYPGPQISPTNPPYPGPSTPSPTLTTPGQVTSSPTGEGTPSSPPPSTSQPGTPGSTVTEQPPQPPISPPPPGSSITIWHSWRSDERILLDSIISSFSRLYPDVTFRSQFVPKNELFKKYHDEVYLGGGPSLLFGPSDWGPNYAQDTLVLNLNRFASPEFLDDINPAALNLGKFQGSLISLPISQYGSVIFRNKLLIADGQATFEELVSSSIQATRAGNVGTYLERGAYFSSPDIIGLGGELMDENGMPAFNNSYGLEWFDLLAAYDEAGAVTFNTNRDLEMFKRGRVGIIIDGTWNISTLAQNIGAENLAIDPWPEFGKGHLSGWVSTESVYVNSNLTGEDLSAALSFIGYLLDPNVQMRLAEVGHIPSILTTEPRDPLIRQAMNAFMNAVPFPNRVDENILNTYWNELNKAISSVFENGVEPATALQTANDNITQIIRDLKTSP